MSYLISREEVLKIVKDTMKLYKWTDLVCDWGKGACEEIEEAINNLSSQNQWISVKDKEPKINEKVLCLTKGGEVYVDKYNSLEEEFILEHLKCTHWQPLPTPPLLDK